MQDTFPNVAIALRMYLVLMVTNCSAERSFSKLKLIESRLRAKGGATVGCGGQCPPTFGTNRVQKVRSGGGPMKMIFVSTADSLYSVKYK